MPASPPCRRDAGEEMIAVKRLIVQMPSGELVDQVMTDEDADTLMREWATVMQSFPQRYVVGADA